MNAMTDTVQSDQVNSEMHYIADLVTQAVKQIDERTFEFTLASENINFPDMSKMDVQTRFASNAPVLINHDHNKIVGQWHNTRYEDGKWKSQAKLSEGDATADWAHNLIKQNDLRAVSIGALRGRDADGNPIPILMEASLVAVGLDKSALAEAYLQSLEMNSEERTMATETQKPDTQGANMISLSQEQLDKMIKDAATQAATDASTSSAEQVAQRMKAERDEATKAMIVAQSAKSLLPNDFDSTGKTVKDVLVQAVGNVVEDPDGKSEDYLQGVVDERVRRGIQPETQSSSSHNENTPSTFNQILRTR